MARAPALHAGGQGFESLILHQIAKLCLVNTIFDIMHKSKSTDKEVNTKAKAKVLLRE